MADEPPAEDEEEGEDGDDEAEESLVDLDPRDRRGLVGLRAGPGTVLGRGGGSGAKLGQEGHRWERIWRDKPPHSFGRGF